jgi:hypothetical protein
VAIGAAAARRGHCRRGEKKRRHKREYSRDFHARVLAAFIFCSALRWRWRIRRPRGHVVSGLSGQSPQVQGNADKSLRREAAARDALARDELVFRSVFLLPMALM